MRFVVVAECNHFNARGSQQMSEVKGTSRAGADETETDAV
jgi:hypothetical protein